MLRINFKYNNFDSFLLYQNSINLQNIFIIVWIVGNNWELQSYYINKKINKEITSYLFTPYIDGNIYQKVKPIFINDNFKIIPFFENLFKSVLSTDTVDTLNMNELQIHQENNNRNYENYIYFHHLRNANISPKQAEKIKKYLGDKKYKILLKYHQTCVFTNNIFEANNFDIAFNELIKDHIE
ncbi:hypothetical protein ACW0S1_04345 [Fusobacterium polymorphum]